MPDMTILVGLDGTEQGDKVLKFTKSLVAPGEGTKIIVCYVIEWSPFAFQSAEENEKRHARREEELSTADTKLVGPVVAALKAEGIAAEGIVKHGHAAEVLEAVATDKGASQIVIGRTTARSVREHVFGSVSVRLASSAPIPVTIVP